MIVVGGLLGHKLGLPGRVYSCRIPPDTFARWRSAAGEVPYRTWLYHRSQELGPILLQDGEPPSAAIRRRIGEVLDTYARG